MLRVWLNLGRETADASSALALARRHPTFALVGVSTADGSPEAVAAAMLAEGEPFHLVTAGPLTKVAELVEGCPQVRTQWSSVVCAAGQLEAPESVIAADRRAAEVVLRQLAPRLVGVEAARDVPAAAGEVFAPLALLSLLRPEAFDLQRLRVLVEKDGRLRLTDDGYAVEYALAADWAQLEGELRRAE